MGSNPGRKGLCVAALQVHCSGTGELAHESFAGSHAGYDSSGCHALHDVLAVPRDEVAVVHNVLFAIGKLSPMLA